MSSVLLGGAEMAMMSQTMPDDCDPLVLQQRVAFGVSFLTQSNFHAMPVPMRAHTRPIAS